MNLTMPWNTKQSPAEKVSGTLDDVRRALASEADHIAEVAAQFGHEAGSQAAKASHEATSQAGSAVHDATAAASGIVQQLVRGASQLGKEIAATGKKSVRDLGHDVQAIGDDLKHVRVTTEPKRTGPDLMPGVTLLGGFGAGIALMYFLDPEQGNRRRALLRDQFVKWTRIGREKAAGTAKDFRNRTVGVMHETRKAVSGAVDEVEEASQPASGMSDGNVYETSDPSTTDTWGEQPIDQEIPARIS